MRLERAMPSVHGIPFTLHNRDMFLEFFVEICGHHEPSQTQSFEDSINAWSPQPVFCLCGSIQFNCRNLQKVSCFVSSMLLCRLPISPAALPSKKPCDASWRFQSHLSLWHRWPRMETVDHITTWFSLHDLNMALTYGIVHIVSYCTR
jgi:hypothetical protein